MGKHLVDIDEIALHRARAHLRTGTIRATVNEALRRIAEEERAELDDALAVLGALPAVDREDAWR
jgi:hypothetical protein